MIHFLENKKSSFFAEPEVAEADRMRITEAVQDKFKRVSSGCEGYFSYPTGRLGMVELGYDEQILEMLVDEHGRDHASLYCGTGNPIALLGNLEQGMTVLDLGCGAGIDALYLAALLKSRGLEAEIYGVDFSKEMVMQGRGAAEALGLDVRFFVASAEELPFESSSFSHIISNSSINLMVDKQAVCSEMHRVLQPQGLVCIVDQFLRQGAFLCSDDIVSSWMN